MDYFTLCCGSWCGITNRSREAMVHMKQPSGYALRAARMKTACSPGLWTVVGIAPGGWGQGRGLAPPRTSHARGTTHKPGFVKEVRNMRCNSPLPQMEDISITAPLPS
ncbi:protein of unknown function [Methanoculleus bourgensis]|uniref:Uncharacterized protein n=1 Tax=Methanoculleus bourgensis TaxID=83986 RepID=A0A0X3BQI0_9EURY|nr:protein of unknown function [Methanoculleus bourgensis]